VPTQTKAVRFEWITFPGLKSGKPPGSPQGVFVTARFRLTNVVKTNAGTPAGESHMDHSLTSREQDLDATPTHQRLLSNLGILAKSQTHSDALHTLLKKDSNHDHRAPANPAAVIRSSSKDPNLTAAQNREAEAERKYGEHKTALQRQRSKRADSRQDDKQLRRMSEARANGGINDEGDEEIGADGVPVTRGMKRAKGSFERMRKALAAKATDSVETLVKSLQAMYGPGATMAKALAEQDSSGESFEERYGIPAHTVVATAVGMKAIRTVKPSAPAKPKATLGSIRKSLVTLAKSLGNETLAKSLEAGCGTDSETLAGGSAMRRQSLDKSRVFGTTVAGDAVPATKKFTAAQIEAATSACLAAGRCTASQAATISTYIAMGSMPPPGLMACLTGESA
jgi:hypothetical protein